MSPSEQLSAEELADLIDWLRQQSHVAFMTDARPADVVAAGLIQLGVEEGTPADRAEQIVFGARDRRARWSRRFAEIDMSGKLLGAFASLEQQGYLARPNLGYSSGEGHDLAVELARRMRERPVGYVFFHTQDAQRLVNGPETLYLRFGAVDYASADNAGKDAEDEAIGQVVMTALRAAGLEPGWNGTAATTIEIPDMAWYSAPR
ncbi:DUF6891 domain-containing protein [Gulosibacter molinativorax]|uniref:DUF6891 domain-containing protein n=1 Tax=Gulosibacter molinativorax TaxID=256821 RepID=A0ABT7C8G5_9MICO|nr:hypothetical protein [Gulosibacter molinativorax]MDJ1371467.1 hypothetical protein [Gulosibacter molinativorax]QUY62407.1 Hypotetical protein [Gulosibacter molinativorax]